MKKIVIFLLLFILINSLCLAAQLDFKITPRAESFGSVLLDWTEYDYHNKNFKIYRSMDGTNFESIGIDYSEVSQVKLLSVYPDAGQGQLTAWLVDSGYGQGVISVNEVAITDFNRNPSTYLYDDGNGWNYDVVFFGTWDRNNFRDLSLASRNVIDRFITAGKGVIFGHDTIFCNSAFSVDNHEFTGDTAKLGQGNFDYIAEKWFKPLYFASTTSRNVAVGSTNIQVTKTGLFTKYPNYVGEVGTVLTIPYCHSWGQGVKAGYENSIWLKFIEPFSANTQTDRNDNNYYLVTYNNLASIQTGHSGGNSTPDEQKILANLVFYMNQLTFNKYATKDTAAQDVAAPDAPTLTEIYSNKVVYESRDNGSTYQYYLESYSKDDTTPSGLIDTSDVRTITVETGLKNFKYIFDNTANTTITSLTGTVTNNTTLNLNSSYRYLHIVAVDGAGNVSPTTHYDLTSFKYPTIKRKVVDVTGAIADTSDAVAHVCTEHSIRKYDGTYHWNECSICSAKYVKAGRPNDSASWANSYLQISTNAAGQRILIIKSSRKKHSYTSQWTLGATCSDKNKFRKTCGCGYSYYDNDKVNPVAHTWSASYTCNRSQGNHYKTCSTCGTTSEVERCKTAAGKTLGRCTDTVTSGTCKTCGGTFSRKTHYSVNTRVMSGETATNITCTYCDTVFISSAVVTANTSNYPNISLQIVFTLKNNYQDFISLSTGVGQGFATIFTRTGVSRKSGETSTKTVTITSTWTVDEPYYLKGPYLGNGFNFHASDGIYSHFLVRCYIIPDVKAPTLNTPTQTTVVESSGWATNKTISVSGKETYCETVNIKMVDTTNSKTVYSGSASVNSSNNYSLTFTPEVGATEEGKVFSITVSDTFGNAITKNITITKYDRVLPTIVKTGQMHNYEGSSEWGTTIPWSRTKNFTITATDEGTNYLEMKLQDVASTKTGQTFQDYYALTTVDESTDPIRYKRDYTFTGDVKGYVTIKVNAVDKANNGNEEYLRVYNLDNLEPVINEPFFEGEAIDTIGSVLQDPHSGIKYFGIIPYTYGAVNYPTTYLTENSTVATELGKWYKVAEVPANSTTGEPESGQSSIEVQFKITENGKYYIIAEDYVGNRSYKVFEADRFDTLPPYGFIQLKNPLYSITNVAGVNKPYATLLVDGRDDETYVSYMSFANENSKNLISWIPYNTEYDWTLSQNDGYKVVYVMFMDSQGNVSVSYVP